MTPKELKAAGIDSLHGTLLEAVYLMKKDEVIKDALGEHILNEFIATKNLEWDEYRKYVTKWEEDRYLNAY